MSANGSEEVGISEEHSSQADVNRSTPSRWRVKKSRNRASSSPWKDGQRILNMSGPVSPERRSSLPFDTYAELDATASAVTTPLKKKRDKDAVKVAVRVRSILKSEAGTASIVGDSGERSIIVVNPNKIKALSDDVNSSAKTAAAIAAAFKGAKMQSGDWARLFEMDWVFTSDLETRVDPKDAQVQLFRTLGSRIIDDALRGANSSCFAYGHTGSGKSYTMFGPESDLLEGHDGKGKSAMGLTPRVCLDLVQVLLAGKCSSLSVTFIEIYNEKIRDLLSQGLDSSHYRVREHPQTGIYVENLDPIEISTAEQMQQLLSLGCSARVKADTQENASSSRGHAILTVEVTTFNGVSKMQMVDLAGSEKEGLDRFSSPMAAVDDGLVVQRVREQAQIKKALGNLGIIIKGLARGEKAAGLPFRETALTWLLKDALCGHAHCRTTMVATVSPSSASYVETMNTLKYAERLRKLRPSYSSSVETPSTPRSIAKAKEDVQLLVKILQSQGAEASRQILYQTVADPQQRLARLTTLQTGGRHASPLSAAEQSTRVSVISSASRDDELPTGREDVSLEKSNEAADQGALSDGWEDEQSGFDISYEGDVPSVPHVFSEPNSPALAAVECLALKRRVAELEYELGKVKVDRDIASAEAKEAASKTEQKDEDSNSFESAISGLKAEKVQLQDVVVQLQTERDRLKSQAAELRRELNRTQQAALDVRRASFDSKQQQYEMQLAALKQEMEKLRNELEIALQERDEAACDYTEATNMLQELERRKSATDSDNDLLHAALAQSKSDLHEAMEVSRSRLATAAEESDQLQQELITCEQVIAQQKEQLEIQAALAQDKQRALDCQIADEVTAARDALEILLAKETEVQDSEVGEMQRLADVLMEAKAEIQILLNVRRERDEVTEMLSTERLERSNLVKDIEGVKDDLLLERINHEKLQVHVVELEGNEAQVLQLKEELQAEKQARKAEAEKIEQQLIDWMTRARAEATVETEGLLEEVLMGVRAQTATFREEMVALKEENRQLCEELRIAEDTIFAQQADTVKLNNDLVEVKKASNRELAALWLAVNKLDIVDLAKDQALYELHSNRRVLEKERDHLRMKEEHLLNELQEIDVSLVQALENRGVSVEEALSTPFPPMPYETWSNGELQSHSTILGRSGEAVPASTGQRLKRQKGEGR